MITQKTISYICWRIENEFPNLFSRIPKHNQRYRDERCDFRRRILEDKIRNYSKRHANYIIEQIGQGNEDNIEKFIFGVENLKN